MKLYFTRKSSDVKLHDVDDKGNVAFYLIPNTIKVKIFQTFVAVAIQHRAIRTSAQLLTGCVDFLVDEQS